jgi:hypothetical protein
VLQKDARINITLQWSELHTYIKEVPRLNINAENGHSKWLSFVDFLSSSKQSWKSAGALEWAMMTSIHILPYIIHNHAHI